MTGRLAGRVALITGGTSGIGEATVERFLEEGARVVFTGRSVESGEAIAARLGPDARYFRADVTREDDIRASVEFTTSTFGRLDILFNNAGGPTGGTPEIVTWEQFEHAMALLVGSVVFGIKHAIPVMKAQQHGRIINNSSIAALRTNTGQYLYSAAKAAVTQLTKVAGMELGKYGITVNCVSPGGVATPIFYGGSEAARQLEPGHNEGKMRKLKENLARANPIHRTGLPRDVANAVLYLASDDGAYINCHDLVVDGGMTAGPFPAYD
ncbi:MAG TPA: SDR family oxidoreductase [Dehalococcoidia bacterium]|nr:SDR family oxidoreductase [Dehalococcoidia bacterium]